MRAIRCRAIGAQVVELFGILWRDDETELVPILAPAFLEDAAVSAVSVVGP
ncbi:hypothetical protein MASR1M60_32390 [Rhodocyclaceae bacterium]